MRAILAAPFSRRPWRELGYLALSLLPAVPTFVLALIALAATPLSLFGVGLPFLAAALLVARLTPAVFRAPARRTLGWDWPAHPPLVAQGLVRRMVAVVRDGPAWRALLYCLGKLPFTALVVYLTVVAVGVSILAVTFPIWWFASHDAFGVTSAYSWPQTWLAFVQGAAVLLVFPWFIRPVILVDHWLTHALLAPSRDRERIADLEASRTALRTDAANVLRRVERDLHDGTQAQLVSVGLMLSRLERRLDNPEQRDLVAAARKQVSDGLDELREIIRGIHPPALDNGLPTALATLASRTAVPTDTSADPHIQTSEAEASAIYFSAAELLTNVARHAHASTASLRLTETIDAITLTVRDDGRGGAQPTVGGSGLDGLRRRAEALDGALSISSPVGGPTTVTMTLPRG